MKALIFGGTGFIGQELTCELLSHDYEVCVVTRSKSRSQEKVIKGVELMEWNTVALMGSCERCRWDDTL